LFLIKSSSLPSHDIVHDKTYWWHNVSAAKHIGGKMYRRQNISVAKCFGGKTYRRQTYQWQNISTENVSVEKHIGGKTYRWQTNQLQNVLAAKRISYKTSEERPILQ
jgi:hypothetical protein